MASSDYTALRKLKEIQNCCEVDELGDPVSTSWYDIPMSARGDCTVGFVTGPTGPAGNTNGGIFTIYASSTGFAVSDNGFIFSFGNGPNNLSTSGVHIGADSSLNYIGVRVASDPTVPGSIEIYKNGYATGIILSDLSGSQFKSDINYSFVKGDYINIKCLSGSGGSIVNVSLWC